MEVRFKGKRISKKRLILNSDAKVMKKNVGRDAVRGGKDPEYFKGEGRGESLDGA